MICDQRHLGSSLLTEFSDRLKPVLHLKICSLHWFSDTVQVCSFMMSACFAGSNQKCYSAAVPGLNSTAWFENYLGSFLEHATVGDLQLFGDEPTVSAGSSWWWRTCSVQNTVCLGGCVPAWPKFMEMLLAGAFLLFTYDAQSLQFLFPAPPARHHDFLW